MILELSYNNFFGFVLFLHVKFNGWMNVSVKHSLVDSLHGTLLFSLLCIGSLII